MKSLVFLTFNFVINIVSASNEFVLPWRTRNPAFDPNFYENALDPEECQRQLEYIAGENTLLRLTFLEAGIRFPRSLLQGNLVDLGDYHQCLRIAEDFNDKVIQGKYCSINVPLEQEGDVGIPFWNYDDVEFMRRRMEKDIEEQQGASKMLEIINNDPHLLRIPETSNSSLANIQLTLAVCVPITCTVREGLSGLLLNGTSLGLEFEENFCRTKNDKPWVPGDYVAIAIFSMFGLLTLLSTTYELWMTFVLKKNPKTASTVLQSFSIYTNTRRLTTFTTTPETLDCVDGIRAIAMGWIVLGHTFSSQPPVLNALETLDWTMSFRSIWLTAAPICVDTFFMLSGMLVVYTTAKKLTSFGLLKNLHLFYLNRILRMFPLLAATVLLQASIFHRITDGPLWDTVASMTEHCRLNWWSTLLYVQNFVRPPCLGHTWYLAIDMQLHILSPLVLFWVLRGMKRSAIVVLVCTLLISLISGSIYNALHKFPGSTIAPARTDESLRYMFGYYMHTLPRAPPFFVGMLFGYLLHLWRDKNIKLRKTTVIIVWIFMMGLMFLAYYATTPMKDVNWDNQTVDTVVNSLRSPAWALSLGWIIFACTNGYGGPVNWLLSLRIWKLPSRLSYAMYLLHYPMQVVIHGMAVRPIYFTIESKLFTYLAHYAFAFLVGFVMTLLIDSPFSTIIKLLLSGGPKKPNIAEEKTKENS